MRDMNVYYPVPTEADSANQLSLAVAAPRDTLPIVSEVLSLSWLWSSKLATMGAFFHSMFVSLFAHTTTIDIVCTRVLLLLKGYIATLYKD